MVKVRELGELLHAVDGDQVQVVVNRRGLAIESEKVRDRVLSLRAQHQCISGDVPLMKDIVAVLQAAIEVAESDE